MKPAPPPWTKVLERIIRSSTELQRLATALGVTTTTLKRWAAGTSTPQPSHAIRLVQVVQSQHRQELLEALEQTYHDIQSRIKAETCEQVSADFYAQVLEARTITADVLRFRCITDLVL